MSTTTIRTTFYTVKFVRGDSINAGDPCPHCSDMDAFVVLNLYVRAWGQLSRFEEACVPCAKRIAVDECPAEVLIEVPEYLREDVAGQLANFS